ncbi:MAG TPA: hypothetical protein DCF70_07470 [Treponema sp.]|nr:hypothetical protein [Treponema sp.]
MWGADYKWNGSYSNNWTDINNWSDDADNPVTDYPNDAGDTVNLDSTSEITVTANVTVGRIICTASSAITINNGITLTCDQIYGENTEITLSGAGTVWATGYTDAYGIKSGIDMRGARITIDCASYTCDDCDIVCYSNGNVVLNSGKILTAKRLFFNGYQTNGSSLLTVNGTANLVSVNAGTDNKTDGIPNVLIDDRTGIEVGANGRLTVSGTVQVCNKITNSGTLTLGGNVTGWNAAYPTKIVNTNTVTASGITFTNVTVSGSGTLTAAAGLTAVGTVSLPADSLGGALTAGNGTTGTTVTLTGDFTATDVSILANATLDAGDTELTVTGDFTNAGTYKAAATTIVGGNWTDNGTFTHNGGTVIFTGSAALVAEIGGSSNTAFNNFTMENAGGKTLTLTGTPSVAGTLTLSGSGTSSRLTVTGTGGFKISEAKGTGQYLSIDSAVSVTDTAGTADYTTLYYEAEGTVPSAGITSDDYKTIIGHGWRTGLSEIDFIWTGATDTSWTEPSNWDMEIVPTAGCRAIIENAAKQPVLTTDLAFGSGEITVESGSTLTLGANSLTCDTFTNKGTVILAGSQTIAITTVTNDDASLVEYTGSGSALFGTTYGNLTIDSTAEFTNNSAITVNAALTNNGILNAAANITFGAGGSISNNGTINRSAGITIGKNDVTQGLVVYTSGGDIQDYGAADYYNLKITGGTASVSSALTVANELTATGGTLSSAQDITVKGTIGFDAGSVITFTAAKTLTTEAGGSIDTITGSAALVAGDGINAATLTIGADSTVGSVTIPANATLDANGTELTVTGDFTNAGTYTAAATTTVGGNWTDNGTFTHNDGTVIFTGAGAVIEGAGKTFNEVQFTGSGATVNGNNTFGTTSVSAAATFAGNNTFGTTTVAASTTFSGSNNFGATTVSANTTFSGSNTFASFTDTTGGTVLTFGAGSTQNVTGDFVITGSAGNLISLQSSTDGVTWEINTTATTVDSCSVNYASVKDSVSTNQYLTAKNSTDNGNNTNWNFAGQVYTWTGATDTDWHNASNWTPASIPGSAGYAVIPAVTTYPVIESATEIAQLTVGESSPSTAQLTVGAYSLKVTGILTNYGKIIYSAGERITSNGTTPINDSANSGTVEYTGTGQVLTDFVATGNDYANLIVSGSITSGGTIVIVEDFSNTGTIEGVTGLSVGDSAAIGAAISVGALTVSGTADIGAAVSAGSVTVSGLADIGANVTTTATQTYSGAVTISNTVNLTGTTVTFNSTVNDSAAGTHGLTVTGDAVLKASVGGTTQLSSVTVSGTTRVDSAISVTAQDVTLTGGATLNGATEINVATLNVGANITGQTLTYSGALNNTGSGVVSLPAFVADGDLTITAGSGVTFSSTFTQANPTTTSLTISGGAVTFGAGAVSTGALTNAGTVSLGSGAVTFNSTVTNNGTITGGSGTIDIKGAYSGTGAAFTASSATTTFEDGVDLSNTTAFNANGGKVIFTGVGAVIEGAGKTFNQVEFRGSGATVNGDNTFGTTTVSAPATFTGNNTFGATSVAAATTFSGSNNFGATTVSASTTFSDSNTFASFTDTTGGTVLTFGAGSTQNVTGDFVITGSAGNLISLLSSADGVSWEINTSATTVAADSCKVNYASVKDSVSTNQYLTAKNSEDNGNNANWNFAGQVYRWTGATDTNWHKAANWSPASIPGNAGYAVIPVVTAYPVIESATEIARLTVGESSPSAAQITVGAYSLKVTDTLTNYGKIIYSAGERITSDGTTPINDSTHSGTVEYTGTAQVLTDFEATGNDYANLIVSGSITSGGTIVIAEDFSNKGAVSGVTAISVGDSADIGATLSAGSLTVSGTSDIGANVTTSAAQTYSGAVTISNTVNLTGSTVTFNSTVNDSAAGTHGLTVTGNAVLKASVGGTAQLSSVTVNGTTRVDSAISVSAHNVTLTGGATLNGATEINAATLNAGSNITGQTLTYSGTLNNTASGAVSLPAFVADGDLTVTAGSGIAFSSTFTQTNPTTTSLTILSGAVTFGSSAFTAGSLTVMSGASFTQTGDNGTNIQSVHAITVANGATMTWDSTKLGGSLEIGNINAQGSLNFNYKNLIISGTLTVDGELTLLDLVVAGSGSVTITGTGILTVQRHVNFANGAQFTNNNLLNLTYPSSAPDSVVNGVIQDNNTDHVNFGNVVVTQGTTTKTISTDTIFTGLTLSDTTAGAGSIIFNGKPAVTTLTNGSGTVFEIQFNAGVTVTNNVTINSTGKLTLGNDASDSSTFSGTLTVPNAAVELNGTINSTGASFEKNVHSTYAVTNNGTITLNAGTTEFDSSLTNNGTITGGSGNIDIQGAYSGTGSFTASAADTTFRADVDLSGTTFVHNGGTVYISPAATSVTVNGNTTFNNLNITVATAKTVTMTAGTTTTVAGVLTLQGHDADNLLTLTSSSTDVDWNLNCTSATDVSSIEYVKVHGSNNTSAYYLTATNSTDDGNNTRWNFIGQAYTWTGLSSTSNTEWNDRTNWSPTSIPAEGTIVTIPSGAASYPVFTADISIGNRTGYTGTLTVESGARLDMAGYGFTVNKITNAGRIRLTGTEVISGTKVNQTDSVIEYYGTLSDSTVVNSTSAGGWGTSFAKLEFTGGANGTITPALTISQTTLFANGSANSITLNGANSFGGDVTFNGSGSIALSGANIYGGIVTILSGENLILEGNNAGFTLTNGAICTSLNIKCPVVLGSVTTTGQLAAQTLSETQYYEDAVTLAFDSTFTGTSGDLVRFGSTVTCASHDLTVSTADVLFEGNVNACKVLLAGADSTIKANITSSDTQTYTGAVTIGADVVLNSTAGDITFVSTVDGSGNFTVSAKNIFFNGTGTVQGIDGTLTFTAVDYIELNGADYVSSGTQTMTAGKGVKLVSTGDGTWTAGSSKIILSETDLFADSDGITTVLGCDLDCRNFYFYRGTLSVAGITITTTDDFAVWGSSYSADDPRYSTTDTRFAFWGLGNLVYQSASFSASFDSISGTRFVVGSQDHPGNFYVNGADLAALSGGLSIKIADSSASGPVFNSTAAVTEKQWGLPYAVLFNSTVANTSVTAHSGSAQLAAAEGQYNQNVTDGSGNSGIQFEHPQIAESWTVYDDVVYVKFNLDIENSNGEILTALSSAANLASGGVWYNSASLLFDGAYSDADCTTKIASNADIPAGTGFYIRAASPSTGTWNTDATGRTAYADSSTVTDVNESTDRQGVHKNITVDLSFLEGLFTAADGHTMCRNYGAGLEENAPAPSYTDTLDKCAPVLVAAYTGQELHTDYDGTTGALSQKYYDSHNFIEFLYSEAVDIATMPADISADIYNVRADSDLSVSGGHIANGTGGLTVQGFASIADGALTSAVRSDAPSGTGASPHSLYRSFSLTAGGSDAKQTNRVRVSIGGYVDGTVSAPSGLASYDYHNWVGYIDNSATPSGSVTVLPNDYITDLAVDLTSATIKNKIDAVGSANHPLASIKINELVNAASPELYGDWDTLAPEFAPYIKSENAWTNWLSTGTAAYYESVGAVNSDASAFLDNLEFHLFDNRQSADYQYWWRSRFGWKEPLSTDETVVLPDGEGGSRPFIGGTVSSASQTTGGIRRSSLAGAQSAFNYKTTSETAYKAPGSGDVHQTVKSSIFRTTNVSTNNDGLYINLPLNASDAGVLSLKTRFDIRFVGTDAFITDLAGNRIKDSIEMESIDITPPAFVMNLSPVGEKKLYAIFSKTLDLPEDMNALCSSLNSALKLVDSGTGAESDIYFESVEHVASADEFSELCFTLNRSVTLSDVEKLQLKAAGNSSDMVVNTFGQTVKNTYIVDEAGNLLEVDRKHAISDFAINAVDVLYAYAEAEDDDNWDEQGIYGTNVTRTLSSDYAVHDFSANAGNYGKLRSGRDITLQLQFTGGSDADGKAYKVQNGETLNLISGLKANLSDLMISDKLNRQTGTRWRVWLDNQMDSLASTYNDSTLPVIAASTAAGDDDELLHNFTFAKDTFNFAAGDEVQFMFKICDSSGTVIKIDHDGDPLTDTIPLYALWMPNPVTTNKVPFVDLWSFSIKDIKQQRGGVTILNNVINVNVREQTVVEVTTKEAGRLNVYVMTLDGNIVKKLSNGRVKAGTHYFKWDGTNNAGNAVARGLYFIRVVGEGVDETRKVMCVKE